MPGPSGRISYPAAGQFAPDRSQAEPAGLEPVHQGHDMLLLVVSTSILPVLR